MLYTTFKLLRKRHACSTDYNKFATLKGGVKAYGDDKPIPLDEIVETMGLADGLWALRALTEPIPNWVWLMGTEFAERVLPMFEECYPADNRPRDAIHGIRDFVAGEITREQLRQLAAAYADAAYADAADADAAYADATDAAYAATDAFSAEWKWLAKRFLGLLRS